LWQYILYFWNDSPKQIAKAIDLARSINVDKFVFQLSCLPLSNSARFAEGSKGYNAIKPYLFDTRRFNYLHVMSVNSIVDGNLVVRCTNKGDIKWIAEQHPWGREIQLVAYSVLLDHKIKTIFLKPIYKDVEPNADILISIPLNVRKYPVNPVLLLHS
jgi:hypothetical protein